MIDLHSHVLPGIDDGPADLEGSLALAQVAASAGTDELVATPHINWTYEVTVVDVLTGVADLQDRLDAVHIPLRLRSGGEVAISRAAELDDASLRALRLGGGEWLLAECPLSPSAVGFEPILHHLQMRGHRILLAHPERSPPLQQDPGKLRALVDAGMLTSITAGSLAGQFGPLVQRFTLDLLEEGLVHNIASDAHDAHHRTPELRDAVEFAEGFLPGLAEHAGWLCVDVPRAILDGGPVPEAPGRPPKRKRWKLLARSRRS